MKGVESLRKQSFKGFWKSWKIPGLDFRESRDPAGACPGPSLRRIIVILVPDLPSWPTLIPKVIWGNWTIWSIPACPRANLASKRLFVTECQVCIMSIIPAVVVPLIAQCPLVGVVHSASFCPHHAASPALCGVHLKKKQNSWDWRSTATTSDYTRKW